MRAVDENDGALNGLASKILPRAFLLLALTLLAFAPALRAGFIWDDDDYVVHNPNLRSVSGLAASWVEPRSSPQYYPMVFTSFWVEFHLWDARPLGYHVDNILLHALAAILLWRTLEKLEVPGAFVAAALFAVHPINVESVAWITERKNVLSAVFYFAAALAYLRWNKSPPGSTRWYLLALVLFVAALLSKTVTCSLPAALLLVVWWKRGKLTSRDVIPLLPMFAIGLLMGGVTAWLERTHVQAVGREWDLSILDRMLIAGRAIWFYATKVLLPFQLSFIYPKWSMDPSALWQWMFPVGVIVVIVVLWLMRDRWGRGPLAGALFFIGTLVPALGFFNIYPMRYSYVADHFTYLAAVGLFVLIAAAMSRAGRWAYMPLVPLLIISIARSTVYHDSLTLFADTVAKNPTSWMAHLNLAKALDEANDPKAGAEIRQAVFLGPDIVDTNMDAGTYSSNHGDFSRAFRYYDRALQLAIQHADPKLPQVYYHRGRAYQKMRQPDKAIREYGEALKLRGDYALARWWQAQAFFQAGRNEDAIRQRNEALRLDPSLGP
jgi:tetratricopeptide (TPR) repeat protein